MRRSLTAVSLACVLGGCGGAAHGADVAVAPCAQPRGLAAAPLPQEQGVYQAGPVTLAIGEDLVQQPAAPSGSDVIAVIRGRRPVTLTVEPASRGRFAIQFERGQPLATVRFPACGGGLHRFGGVVAFSGSGCVRLRATPGGEMLIPIGNSLRGCPERTGSHRLGSGVFPYLGVSCPVGDLITCDRVGIGVILHQPAALVTLQLAGRTVALSPPTDNSGLWLGYLDHAGLRHGPLAVRARGNYWDGEPLVTPQVVLTVFFADGTITRVVGAEQLHAGFG